MTAAAFAYPLHQKSGDHGRPDRSLELRLARFRQAASGNDLNVRVHLAPAKPGAQPLSPDDKSSASQVFVRSVVLGASLAAAGVMGLCAYGLATSASSAITEAPQLSTATGNIGAETLSTPREVTPALTSPAMTTAAMASTTKISEAVAVGLPVKASDSKASNAKGSDALGIGAKLNYVNVTYAGEKLTTLDAGSRILLAKAAASKAGLSEVGLGWQELYGVIHAETSWIARGGMGKNGVVSHGLAQFEPGTAREMSLENPNDPVQAVYASAELIKRAALWTHERVDPLKLGAEKTHQALLEGVSVYYNLGWKRRHAWKPSAAGDQKLPTPTVAHIQNVENGAIIAKEIEKELAKSGLVLASYQALSIPKSGQPSQLVKKDSAVNASSAPITSLQGSSRTLKVIEAEVQRDQRLKAAIKAQLVARAKQAMGPIKVASKTKLQRTS